jgi:hypothetical protein
MPRAGRVKNQGWSPSRDNISVSSPQNFDRLWGPPSKWILGAVSPGIKRKGREAGYLPENGGAIPLLLHTSLGRGA